MGITYIHAMYIFAGRENFAGMDEMVAVWGVGVLLRALTYFLSREVSVDELGHSATW